MIHSSAEDAQSSSGLLQTCFFTLVTSKGWHHCERTAVASASLYMYYLVQVKTSSIKTERTSSVPFHQQQGGGQTDLKMSQLTDKVRTVGLNISRETFVLLEP